MPFKYALPFRNFPNERNHPFYNGEFGGLLFKDDLLSGLKSSATFTRASGQWIMNDPLEYVGVDIPGFTDAGIQLEGASTNKCECWSIPTPQAPGSEQSSGTLTKGKVYLITATETDHFYVGCQIDDEFVAESATSLDANNKVKELPQAEGTKTFHDGSDWIQNIPNMTLAGDTTAELSIVDDTTEIEAAGLGEICPEGLVYKVDNSGGSSTLFCRSTGQSGNLNKHSYKIIARASSIDVGNKLRFAGGAAGYVSLDSTDYETFSVENDTPPFTGSYLEIRCVPGYIIYFIVSQLEEKTFCTSTIKTEGASATRDATLLLYPVAENLPVNDFSIEMEVTPWATGQGSKVLFSSYYDASNYFSIETTDTQIILKKVVAGTPHSATFTYTHTKDTLFTVKVIVSSTRGMELSINAGTVVTDTNKTDCVSGSAFEVGSMNDGSRFAGMTKNLKIHKYAKPASWLEI